jgi:hypothetical protein
VSRKTQRKPRAVHVTMGVETMRLDPEDERCLCIETRVRPGATVVPHNKWANGAWRDWETGKPMSPPEHGRKYAADLKFTEDGNLLISYPSWSDGGSWVLYSETASANGPERKRLQGGHDSGVGVVDLRPETRAEIGRPMPVRKNRAPICRASMR